MTWMERIDGPSDAELRAIELESDVLAAEMTLVDAEMELRARPGRRPAAAYLQALLALVDLHEFTDHGEPRPSARPELEELRV